ncbi:unnamed protein product [Chondrus crispus]|uniref:DNA-directed RNA polymerase III subunit RPC5 n=1 Tax=Chondrus crispus TaxID=2769 RepID=R7QD67_CHOCR|nr:unnamed protein product [Chondrus crispus]CDF35395.1 unnamed protein product [Chondrus crispus]|eukprot:XP_005715214.1 unnamed protein product [Chondrus crispus]
MSFPHHDDEEDQVVGEVDIFLSQPKDSCELHVLQYPLRNAMVGIGKDRRVTGVNVRPKHGRVEVKLAVLPDNPDPDEITATGGCTKSFDMAQELADEKNIGEEQVLRSRPNRSAPDSNYAVASYIPPESTDDNRACFTIVPLRSVIQLRPTFDYLDVYDASVAKHRAEEKAARDKARGLHIQSQKQDDGDVAPLQVSFRRRETERAAERRKSSHATLRQQEEGEAWVPLEFVPHGHVEAKHQREFLFNASLSSIASVVKEEAMYDVETTYTDLFCTHTRHVQLGLVAKANNSNEPLSAKALRRLPIEAAVAHVLIHARIVSYREICELLGKQAQAAEVLHAIRLGAFCLRGCWAAKKGRKKGLAKQRAIAERYDASRVLVLNLFRTSRIVSEQSAMQALGETVMISESSIEAILKEVADRKRGVGWEFRLEDGCEFVAQNPELCKVQDDDWERRVASATEALAKKKRKKKKR